MPSRHGQGFDPLTPSSCMWSVAGLPPALAAGGLLAASHHKNAFWPDGVGQFKMPHLLTLVRDRAALPRSPFYAL